jgi:hypothetical protein
MVPVADEYVVAIIGLVGWIHNGHRTPDEQLLGISSIAAAEAYQRSRSDAIGVSTTLKTEEPLCWGGKGEAP